MALGDITPIGNGETKAIELLASATATNSPPSGSSAGIAWNDIVGGFGFSPEALTLAIASTAGSGTMTATFKLWGYIPMASGKWLPLGPGGDTTKGTINDGTAIGETSADSIVHCEPVDLAGHFQRLYLEITAIGGTATAVTAWLIGRRGA
jgi:hypothetical protein